MDQVAKRLATIRCLIETMSNSTNLHSRVGDAGPGPTRRQLRRRAKEDAILAAGRSLLLMGGYGSASMDDVARVAGVSKATLYTIFTSKDELFVTLVRGQGRPVGGADLPEMVCRDSIRRVLIDYANRIVNILISPPIIASYRTIAAESARSPDLGRIFYANGPDQLLTGLSDYFGRLIAAGLLRDEPQRLLASHFVELTRGDLLTRSLLGMGDTITAEEVASINRSGVDAFLRAYLTPLPAAPGAGGP